MFMLIECPSLHDFCFIKVDVQKLQMGLCRPYVLVLFGIVFEVTFYGKRLVFQISNGSVATV